MHFRSYLLLLVLSLMFSPTTIAGDEPKPAPFEATDRYETRLVQGWTIRVHPSLLKEKDLFSEKVFELLNHQLYQVVRKVPSAAVAKLKTVTIWLELNDPHHPCMVYHPDKGWLVEHGMNPEKARCVEISNAGNFLDWSLDQPWMVFHELAHAYHHQFLPDGFENRAVAERYREAMAAGTYRQVLHFQGKLERSYAETDPMEYFAEAAEAHFGTNDFYPFVRAELKKHDPKLEALLDEVWAIP